MKTIARRLHKLEDRLGLQPEPEFDRRLRARSKAAERRLGESRERSDLQPPETACRQRLMRALGFS